MEMLHDFKQIICNFQLAKIERVEEKLHAMSFMGHINSRVIETLKVSSFYTGIYAGSKIF